MTVVGMVQNMSGRTRFGTSLIRTAHVRSGMSTYDMFYQLGFGEDRAEGVSIPLAFSGIHLDVIFEDVSL